MNRTTRRSRGRKPASHCLPRALCVAGLLSCCAAVGAADDPYLELIDKEVSKVEAVPTDTAGNGEQSPDGPSSSTNGAAVPSRDDFEATLRRQHVGTYSFYRRLPERSREEIFLDYSSGASMEALRGKIIDRYLHP